LDSSESLQYVSDPQGSGKSAKFDGASDIEVPYFQNNEFRQFTLALKFKKAAGSASNQGLVSNGGNPAGGSDFDPPSIYLSIKNGYLVAGIITDDGAAEIQSSDLVNTVSSTFLKYSPLISVVTVYALEVGYVCAFPIVLLEYRHNSRWW
jgi:hypothetical protein